MKANWEWAPVRTRAGWTAVTPAGGGSYCPKKWDSVEEEGLVLE